MIKGVIFDFWGTLIENGIFPSPVKQAKYIMRVPLPFKDFVVKFEDAMMTKPYKDMNEAFDAACKEFNIPAKPFVKEKLVGMWNKNELLGKPFLETVEILEYLKSKKLKLGLVSNTTPTITRVLDKYGMHKYFDAEVFSFDTGLLKTDPEMFQLVLDKMGLKADEVIMIGDSMQTDVLGARNAGINSILLDRGNKREVSPKIVNLRELKAMLEEGTLEDFAAQELVEQPREEMPRQHHHHE